METKVLDKGFVRLIDSMGGDSAIVQAARVSYGKGTKTVSEDRALIRFLMRHRHTSVFEQVVLKFHIKAPISVIRQFFRHRTQSVNELSLRYSEASEDYYLRDLENYKGQGGGNKQVGGAELSQEDREFFHYQMEKHSNECLKTYQLLIDCGLAREAARDVLPVNWYSEFYTTINLHNLFHLIGLRVKPNAQYEIRQFARALLEGAQLVAPAATEAFKDYVLDSISFSRAEIEAFKGREGDLEGLLGVMGKTEKAEFLRKLEVLGVSLPHPVEKSQ